jgi:hypothetical protein
MNAPFRSNARARACLECGAPLAATRRRSFCDQACRNAWNHRRHQRGADLYELFMASRLDLEAARDLKVWREMNRLAARWHAEDQAAGRISWHPPARTLARLRDDGRLPRGDLLCRNYRAGR